MTEEQIVVFHEEEIDLPIAMDRKEFRTNRHLYMDYYVHVIDLFVFNSYGELFVQKRARTKATSPWKFHTSVGGHVNVGESPYFTILHECIEELWAPCYLTENKEQFAYGLNLVGKYVDKFVYLLQQKEYFRNVDIATPMGHVEIKDKAFVCFGLYDWPVHNIDRSAHDLN